MFFPALSELTVASSGTFAGHCERNSSCWEQLPVAPSARSGKCSGQAWVAGAGFIPGSGRGDGVQCRLVGWQVELT